MRFKKLARVFLIITIVAFVFLVSVYLLLAIGEKGSSLDFSSANKKPSQGSFGQVSEERQKKETELLNQEADRLSKQATESNKFGN